MLCSIDRGRNVRYDFIMLNRPSSKNRAPDARGGHCAERAIMAKKETVTLAELRDRIAKAKAIPSDKAGKALRGRIRASIDAGTIVPAKHWPLYAKAGKANRDGNRYPEMPKELADALFTSMTKGKALKELLAKPARARRPKADDAPAPAPTVTPEA